MGIRHEINFRNNIEAMHYKIFQTVYLPHAHNIPQHISNYMHNHIHTVEPLGYFSSVQHNFVNFKQIGKYKKTAIFEINLFIFCLRGD